MEVYILFHCSHFHSVWESKEKAVAYARDYTRRFVINHPVEQSKQWEVGCKEMQRVARITLEGKRDD